MTAKVLDFQTALLLYFFQDYVDSSNREDDAFIGNPYAIATDA